MRSLFVEQIVCGARKRHLAARNKNRHYSRGAIDVKLFRRKCRVLFREIVLPSKAIHQITRSRNEFCSRDFRVIRAPVLAKILSAGSLTGIGDLLQGEGITFSRLRIPFHWKEGRIEVTDASAVGAMGITADGTIDRVGRKVDLRGRVIPAYSLNSALGKIPYVGDFLVGGKGEGVFGIDYRVNGAIDQPDVSVNALSALAPGALRKLFVDPFRESEEEQPPAAAK